MFKCDLCGKEKNEKPHIAESLKVKGAKVLVCSYCHKNASMGELVKAMAKKESDKKNSDDEDEDINQVITQDRMNRGDWDNLYSPVTPDDWEALFRGED